MRALAAAAALALSLPLLAAAFLVTGGTSSGLPLALALVATALVTTAAALGRLRLYTAGGALGLFLVLVSAGVDSVRVGTPADLGAARFGLPFAFVEAELSATPPLPYDLTWNPYEDPARLLEARFLASCAVGVALVSVVALFARLATGRGAG